MLVKSFLNLPSSKGFNLIAAERKLDNLISGVNIMDNPNATDWFSAGELLVTSGFFFGEDPVRQRSYIQKFKDINLAAICIKELTYYKKIPDTLINLCEEIGIPLIEIPYGLAFSRILNNVMNELSPTINHEKQLALDSHSRFFEASLNGGGLEVITHDLENMIRNPVLILDSNWALLSHEAVEADWLYELTIGEDHIRFDLENLEDLPQKIEEIKHPIYRHFKKGNHSVHCCIMPIYFNTINYGFIVVLVLNEALSNLDYVFLETAAMSLALQISHQSEADRNTNRVVRDFFKHLLSGKQIDVNLLKTVDIDIDYKAHYSSIVFDIEVHHDGQTNLIQRKQIEGTIMLKLLEDIKRFSRDSDVELQIFKQGTKIFAFLKNKPDQDFEDTKKEERLFFTQLLETLHLQSYHKISIKVLIGSPQVLSDILISYEEALQIETFAHQSKQSIFFYDEFYLEMFLNEHIHNKDEHQFMTHYLNPLIHYDETNHTELMATLKAYLSNHFNIATTSRELFIHRNTMLYRLEKIQDLLSIDIYDPSKTLALHLAFAFYDKNTISR